MAEITLTLRDTPSGGVAIQSSLRLTIGQPCTPAQGHALEIINRTHKQWGLTEQAEPSTSNQRAEAAAIEQTAGMPDCPKCGNNRQVWRNQISGMVTCHRAHCDTVIGQAQGGTA